MSGPGEFKTCPFCRQQIRQEAVKCRFCGEWLEDEKHSVPSRTSEGHVSEPLASAAQQSATPSGFNIWPIVRDVTIIWVLSFLGGMVAGVAGPRQNTETVWTSTGVVFADVLFGIVGFCISGCLAKGNRWKHLGYVAFFVLLTSIVNVFLRLAFELWLLSVFGIFAWMGVGGGLSYLFKRRT